MELLQIENLCLFCAAQCSPKFILQCDGKLAKLKTEESSHGLFSSRAGNGTEELLLIEEDLKAVFIVRQLLNIPSTDWSEYLSKYDGQHRPGYWFSVCELCDNIVYQCYQCYREITKLEKALEAGKLKLKRCILKSTIKGERKFLELTQNNEEFPSVWKSIRNQVNTESLPFQNEASFDHFNHHVKHLTLRTRRPTSNFLPPEDDDGLKSENDEEYIPPEEDNPPTPPSPTTRRKKRYHSTRKVINNINAKSTRSQATRMRKKQVKKRTSKLPLAKSKRQNWSVITLTDGELQTNWRNRGAQYLSSCKLITYYCYHGGYRCGARLKKRISYNSNDVIIESNNIEHSNHTEKDMITEEQKQLILDSLSKNIVKPRHILSNFHKTGIAPPTKTQLGNYLARCRTTNVIPRTAFGMKLALSRKKRLWAAGNIPHSCKHCGKKCGSISLLKRHEAVFHQETSIKINDYETQEDIKIETETQSVPSTTTDDDNHCNLSARESSQHDDECVPSDENSLISTDNTERKLKLPGRPRGKTIKKSPIVPKKTGKRQNWTVVTLTDEELQNNWRVRGAQNLSDCKLQTFYCCFGKGKCGVRIKKRIFHNSGEIIMEMNDLEHSNHTEKSTLTNQQKQLILDSLTANIDQPKDIMSAFKQKNVLPPSKAQLTNFLARQRKLDLIRNSKFGGTLFLSRKEHCKGPEENPFACQYCDQRCKTIMSLEVHQSETHQDVLEITPAICELCGLSTGSTRYFEFHKKSNCLGSARRQYKCQICGQSFNYKKSLMEHMSGILHKDADEGSPSHFQYINGSYACNYCGERYKTGIKIVTHLKAMHKEKTKTEFRCEGCLLVFDKLRLLWNHRKICESLGGDGGVARKAAKTKKAEEGESIVKVIRCKHCKMEFSSYKICFTHKKKAHPELFSNHMCDSCGRRFMTMHRLTKHKKVCATAPTEEIVNHSGVPNYLK